MINTFDGMLEDHPISPLAALPYPAIAGLLLRKHAPALSKGALLLPQAEPDSRAVRGRCGWGD